MPKPSRAKRDFMQASRAKRDFMQVAREIVEEAIGERMDGTPLGKPDSPPSKQRPKPKHKPPPKKP